jgi:hypothetical protein
VLTRIGASPARRGLLTLPRGHTYLLFAGDARGSIIAEVGASERRRQVSVRAGRYFVRGRAADHLLEGTVVIREGERREIAAAALTRVAYARLVRKGGGLARLAHGPVAGYRMRLPLAAGASACHGVTAGWSFDMSRYSITPRLSACRGAFANQTLRATEDEVAAGARLAHAWDLPGVTLDLGVELGAAVIRQTFATRGVAPDRLTAAGRVGVGAAASRDIARGWYASVELGGETYLLEQQEGSGSRADLGLATPFVGVVLVGVGTRLISP